MEQTSQPQPSTADTQSAELGASRDSLERLVRPLLLYINDTPELLSLLYDMDMLPEQLREGTREWGNMLMLTEAWKNRQQWPNEKAEPPLAARENSTGETP